MLNGFGRAFKSAGYTLVGAQPKLEGEGLSIPGTLNMAVLTTAGYEKTNQATQPTIPPSPTKSAGDGVVYVPGSGGELALFFGGRVSDNAGFLAELGNGHPPSTATTTTIGISSAKLPLMFNMPFMTMEDTRAGIVPFTTNYQGASYGFELLNTGASAVHMMSVPGLNGAHAAALSAQQYINTAGHATGIAAVASSSLGFINVTKFNQTGAGGVYAGLTSTYIRIAGIFSLAGWDAAAGIQNWSGKSATTSNTAGVAGQLSETEATAVDAQMQGAWANMPVGLYASYATAPSPVSGNPSTFNTTVATGNGTTARNSLNVSGELGLMPEKLTIGIAVRRGKSGVGSSNDNAIMLNSTYKFAQNMLGSVSLTKATGSFWYSNGSKTGTTDIIGNTTLTINLFTLF